MSWGMLLDKFQWFNLMVNISIALLALGCGKINLALYFGGASILLVGVLRGLQK